VKFGVTASGCDVRVDPAFLQDIAKAGFEGIELPVRDPINLQVMRYAHERLRAMQLEVTVAGDSSPTLPLDIHLCRLIDVCTVLDARMLSGPFGSVSDVHLIDALKVAAAYAERFGVTIALSAPANRDELASGTVSALVRVVDAVGASNVGVVYNTFDAHADETSIGSAILAAGHRIKHVQLAENNGAAPGRGQVRWNEIFAALDAIRYDGWYMIDVKRDADVNALLGLSFLRRHRLRVDKGIVA
jgi:sugar phosphate isomerase/epimerase